MAEVTFTNIQASGGNSGFGLNGVILAESVLNGTATLDPISLVDGAGETFTITVTGAEVGDYCMVAPGVDLEELMISYSVTSDDTVEVRLQNESTSTVDLATSTWKAKVIKDGL